MSGERDALLDAWDQIRIDLVKADANLWRARELLLEWMNLHDEDATDDTVDAALWLDRLRVETRAFLLSTPDVVQIPPSSGGVGRSGKRPASPAGGAA